MKIALLGYGKMGKAIEKILIKQPQKYEIVLRVDSKNSDFLVQELAKADVAIEFSTPEAVVSNIKKCVEAGVPIVVGTTAWYTHFDVIEAMVLEQKTALLHGTNFSVGMNLLFRLNKQLAQWTEHLSFDVQIDETHHTQKKDAPSGSAITLAEGVLDFRAEKESWVNEMGDLTDKQLLINSFRRDDVKGEHSVFYKNEQEEIEIRHKAFSREGFANGAVLAAEFLIDKKGVFRFDEMLFGEK